MSNERILIVHVAGIGDAVMASTIVERLRTERPGANITWVCGDTAAPVVRLFDGVDRVITVDQPRLYHGNPFARMKEIVGLWRRIGRAYDRAIVLHPDPRYRALVLHLVGVPTVYLSRARHGEMNPIPGRFLGDEFARLAGPDARAHVGPIERRFPIADLRGRMPRTITRTARPRIVLVPGGARNALRENPLRRWPVECYADVARALTADGCQVALVGADFDAWARPAFAGIGVVDHIGALSLVETLQVMRDADVVVSHDTGPLHLARLVRTPLVALFGPTNPSQFLSVDDTVRVLWGGQHLACRPCYDGREFAKCARNVCVTSITPDAVLETVRDLLAAAGRPSPSEHARTS